MTKILNSFSFEAESLEKAKIHTQMSNAEVIVVIKKKYDLQKFLGCMIDKKCSSEISTSTFAILFSSYFPLNNLVRNNEAV